MHNERTQCRAIYASVWEGDGLQLLHCSIAAEACTRIMLLRPVNI